VGPGLLVSLFLFPVTFFRRVRVLQTKLAWWWCSCLAVSAVPGTGRNSYCHVLLQESWHASLFVFRISPSLSQQLAKGPNAFTYTTSLFAHSSTFSCVQPLVRDASGHDRGSSMVWFKTRRSVKHSKRTEGAWRHDSFYSLLLSLSFGIYPVRSWLTYWVPLLRLWTMASYKLRDACGISAGPTSAKNLVVVADTMDSQERRGDTVTMRTLGGFLFGRPLRQRRSSFILSFSTGLLRTSFRQHVVLPNVSGRCRVVQLC